MAGLLHSLGVFLPVFADIGKYAAAHADRVACHVTRITVHKEFPRKTTATWFSCRMVHVSWMRNPFS